MGKTAKKTFILVFMIIAFIIFIGIIVPLFHDFLFDRFAVRGYEEKEGIVSEVNLNTNKYGNLCENILVDNYNIFIKCGEDYKQQFNKGDKVNYYVYKGKGYHTEAQMKSASLIGKILDYGMLATYTIVIILIGYKERKIMSFVDELSER